MTLPEDITSFILKYKLGINTDFKGFKSYKNIVNVKCTNKNLIIYYRNGKTSYNKLPEKKNPMKIKRRVYSSDIIPEKTIVKDLDPYKIFQSKFFDPYLNIDDPVDSWRIKLFDHQYSQGNKLIINPMYKIYNWKW